MILQSKMVDSIDYLKELNWFSVDQEGEYGFANAAGNYFKLSASAYTLLRAVQAGHSFADIAQQMSQSQGRVVTGEDVKRAYEHVMGQIEQLDSQNDSRQSGFWWRMTVVPATVVNRLAPYFTFLFNPIVAVVLLVFTITTISFGWQGSGWLEHLHADGASFLLLLLAGVVHEFGHAIACKRYGADPKEIGFTLYWFFPALYSDVSGAWQLTRWQRLVVDFGGVYLQLVVGACYLCGYYLLGWEPLLDAALLVFYVAVFALNPIFKFDGYWVLSDLLGVTNLSRQPRRLWQYARDKLTGRVQKPLPWPTTVVAVLVVYSLVSVIVWGYFVGVALPNLWQNLVTYPLQLSLLLKVGAPFPVLVRRTTSALFALIIFAGIGRLLWRVVRQRFR